ncbi:FAD-binding oxidoreductase [Aeromicrobium sp.]|uniref:FAD-binding oxidoreductase n=1 Tax=Aeromicrobium sp. TaxID=1871063 RepID=UPI002FC5D68A
MTILDPASPATTHPDAVAQLRADVIGPVLVAGDDGMAAETATFNLAAVHDPAIAVGATCAEDVQAAVRWAVAHGLHVAVQATGHGPVAGVGRSTVLITTSRMRAVSIDPSRGVARVEAGTRWGDVIGAAALHGLAPVCGSSSQVGVVGFTLGGGIGPFARERGFGADQVTYVEMVTADGELTRVDADNRPDLFWAVRGGKGNFGIVTEMEFRLAPVSSLYGAAVFYAAESASEVLHAYRSWCAGLPEPTTTSIAFLRLPPLDTLPEPLRGQFVVHLRFAHNGPDEEGERLLAPMLEIGTLLHQAGTMPSSQFDAIHQDPTDPLPVWERGGLLSDLTAETVDAIVRTAGPDVDIPLFMVEVRQLGGALARQPEAPNAVAGRDGAFSVLLLGPGVPGIEEAAIAAGDDIHAALSPWLTGTSLLNFLGDSTTPEQVARAWKPEVHQRLLAIKHEVDPDNVFRMGHALSAE